MRQGDATAARDRAQPSNRKTIRQNVRSASWQRLFRRYGQDARPRCSAMLHARHHLLSHITAFLEVHAMQEIEARLMREGVAIGVILAAFGDGERDAIGFVVVEAR